MKKTTELGLLAAGAIGVALLFELTTHDANTCPRNYSVPSPRDGVWLEGEWHHIEEWPLIEAWRNQLLCAFGRISHVTGNSGVTTYHQAYPWPDNDEGGFTQADVEAWQ